MSNLHPTMTQALESFFQAIGATDTPAQANTPPNPVRPVERCYWASPDKRLPQLAVDYLRFPIQYGKRDEWGQLMDPDYPAGVEIQAVWLGAHDIYSLMSDELLTDIEASLSDSD